MYWDWRDVRTASRIQGLRHADENGGDGDQAAAKPGFSSEDNPYQKPKTQRIWPTIFLKMGGLSPALSKLGGGRVPPVPPCGGAPGRIVTEEASFDASRSRKHATGYVLIRATCREAVSQNLPIWVGNDTQKQIIFHSHFQILKWIFHSQKDVIYIYVDLEL